MFLSATGPKPVGGQLVNCPPHLDILKNVLSCWAQQQVIIELNIFAPPKISSGCNPGAAPGNLE